MCLKSGRPYASSFLATVIKLKWINKVIIKMGTMENVTSDIPSRHTLGACGMTVMESGDKVLTCNN